MAHVAFSPVSLNPIYLASGTASDQNDLNTNARPTLDLYEVDLSSPSSELTLRGSCEIESRFSRLIWSDYSSTNGKNLLIGGLENSKICLYDYERMLNNSNSLVQSLGKHTGAVSALDINPFQPNLLASGAGSSDIFIWDLNNPQVPMTPGTKLQPLDDINCVAWNNQVQHILASTSSGKCVVWDLRKNESIIKVSDSVSKMRIKQVAWHPDIATQMCLSSEDDNTPYLQIWDLRFATSPVRVLEGHQRGILSFKWCSRDSNLLLSSGKDSRLLVWNPNNPTVNGEIVYDLTTVGQWCFDLSWSKRNPNLVCTSSFESQVNVYSLMGGRYNVTLATSSKIMDSFGVDNDIPGSPTSIPQQSVQIVEPLKIAPSWMRKTCGARFGFGGKLVTFGKYSDTQTEQQITAPTQAQISSQRVLVNQVITDQSLVEKSHYLENALQNGSLVEYCNFKIENSVNQNQAHIWKYILASFEQDKKSKYLELLGFNNETLEIEVKKILREHHPSHQNESNLAESFEKIGLNGQKSSDNGNIFGLNEENNADENAFDDIARSVSPVNLNFSDSTENLITELLLLGKYENVVDILVQEERFTEAILISNYFDKNLFQKTQQRYFRHFYKNKFSNLLEKLINRNWSGIVATCNLNHWKEALATIVTYTSGQEQMSLCDELGKRLEADASPENLINSCICYICSANLENLVNCWQKSLGSEEANTSESLQDLVEKIMVLKYCFKNYHPEISAHLNHSQSLHKLNSQLVKYAKLLADQGCFLNAYSYLNDSTDSSILEMKDRIYHVLDPMIVQQFKLRKPENPFKTVHHQSASKRNSFGPTSHMPNVQNSKTFNPTMNTPAQYPPTSHFNSMAPVNHPMPISTLYPSQDLTKRSTTPIFNKPLYNQTNSTIPTMPGTTNMPSIAPLQHNPSELSQNTGQSYFTPGPSSTQPQVSQNPSIQSYMNTRPASGWNDPPIVAPKVKNNLNVNYADKPAFFQPSVTTSVPMINQNLSVNPPKMFQQQQQDHSSSGITSMSMINQNLPVNTHQIYQPPNADAAQFQPQQTFQPQLVQQTQQQPEKTVEKGPIPSEHSELQFVFDSLLNKTLSMSSNATTKRKLEDVGKKLEVLYDKLRDSSLSPNVVQSLHSMIGCFKVNDFISAIQVHSQIVATSNFSEISGFMPGLKVLIQTCQQMNITF